MDGVLKTTREGPRLRVDEWAMRKAASIAERHTDGFDAQIHLTMEIAIALQQAYDVNKFHTLEPTPTEPRQQNTGGVDG